MDGASVSSFIGQHCAQVKNPAGKSDLFMTIPQSHLFWPTPSAWGKWPLTNISEILHARFPSDTHMTWKQIWPFQILTFLKPNPGKFPDKDEWPEIRSFAWFQVPKQFLYDPGGYRSFRLFSHSPVLDLPKHIQHLTGSPVFFHSVMTGGDDFGGLIPWNQE